ncbi:MAG: hypothetical protein LBN40_06285 [Oscillospiraceae bacterium]|nr:hypothetical protein [Oscillospiraceae bacterium]
MKKINKPLKITIMVVAVAAIVGGGGYNFVYNTGVGQINQSKFDIEAKQAEIAAQTAAIADSNQLSLSIANAEPRLVEVEKFFYPEMTDVEASKFVSDFLEGRYSDLIESYTVSRNAATLIHNEPYIPPADPVYFLRDSSILTGVFAQQQEATVELPPLAQNADGTPILSLPSVPKADGSGDVQIFPEELPNYIRTAKISAAERQKLIETIRFQLEGYEMEVGAINVNAKLHITSVQFNQLLKDLWALPHCTDIQFSDTVGGKETKKDADGNVIIPEKDITITLYTVRPMDRTSVN